MAQFDKPSTTVKKFFKDAHQRLDDLVDIEQRYYELIMAVGNKYPNETRHQTALRYIRAVEEVKPSQTMRAI